MKDEKKTINTFTIINIFVLIIVGIIVFLNWNIYYSNHSWTKRASIISIGLLLYQIIIMIKSKIKIYDFRLWFIIFNYLFIFGRVYLNALNLDKEIFWNLMKYYDDVSMNRAAFYGLLYIQSIFTGMFFKTNKKSINDNISNKKIIDKKEESNKLYFIGIIIILFSLPFKIYNDYLSIVSQRISGGYVSITSDNALFQAFGLLLPIGFIYMIVANKINRKKLNFFLLLYIFYTIGIMIFSGDRRYAITSFLSIILCYMKTFDLKINIKKILLYGIIAVIALFGLAAIRNARLYVINSFSDFWNMLVDIATNSNFIYETLAEFGLTFFIYSSIIKFFPSQFSFKFGTTYLFAPFTIIPMSGTLFPGVQESVAPHMNCKTITNHSLGAALGAELYGNFGLIAPIFAILIGILLSKIMNSNRIEEKDNKKEAIKYYSAFYILINLVRASTTETFRLVVYSLFIPWFIGVLYNNRKRRI